MAVSSFFSTRFRCVMIFGSPFIYFAPASRQQAMMGHRCSRRNKGEVWRATDVAPYRSGRVLATAGEHVFIDQGFGRFLATAAAHADRQPRLHIAKRRGAAIHRFMYLAVSDRAADAYVHQSLPSGSKPAIKV